MIAYKIYINGILLDVITSCDNRKLSHPLDEDAPEDYHLYTSSRYVYDVSTTVFADYFIAKSVLKGSLTEDYSIDEANKLLESCSISIGLKCCGMYFIIDNVSTYRATFTINYVDSDMEVDGSEYLLNNIIEVQCIQFSDKR